MIAATAVASICAFLVVLRLVRVIPASAGAVAIARDALGVLRDAELDDAAREAAVQRASVRLLTTFFAILARGATAIGASLVPIWLADVAGIAPSDRVIEFLARWDVIAIASVVIVIGYLVRVRLWASN